MSKIPKKIHYCWFGKGEKNETIKKCIDSWKKYMPDYEIIEWNENNFDINYNDYCKEAYEAKKYAFVSDVARLVIIHENGGIYFDVDVEALKSFDDLLDYESFFGFEDDKYISTGIGFGAKKGNKLVKKILDDYENIHFNKSGKLDLTPCPIRNSKVMEKYGIELNGKQQQKKDYIIFSKEYFSPKNPTTLEVNISDNTYSIHHFDGSWFTEEEKKLVIKRGKLIKKYGQTKGIKKYNRILFIRQIKYYIKKIVLLPTKLIKK